MAETEEPKKLESESLSDPPLAPAPAPAEEEKPVVEAPKDPQPTKDESETPPPPAPEHKAEADHSKVLAIVESIFLQIPLHFIVFSLLLKFITLSAWLVRKANLALITSFIFTPS